LDKLAVSLRDHVLKLFHIGLFNPFGRDQQIDAVSFVSHMLVNPVELGTQSVRGES
jgi:hypothetical protein